MKGLGTDDQALIRIVVSRCECDMIQIMDSFKLQFNGTLADWIKVGAESFLYYTKKNLSQYNIRNKMT